MVKSKLRILAIVSMGLGGVAGFHASQYLVRQVLGLFPPSVGHYDPDNPPEDKPEEKITLENSPDLQEQVDALNKVVLAVDVPEEHQKDLQAYAVGAYNEGLMASIHETTIMPHETFGSGCGNRPFGKYLNLHRTLPEVDSLNPELNVYAEKGQPTKGRTSVLESLLVNTHEVSEEIRPQARKMGVAAFKQGYMFGTQGRYVMEIDARNGIQKGVELKVIATTKVSVLKRALDEYVRKATP